MGKSRNTFWTIVLGTAVAAGALINYRSCNVIDKQEIVITNLETKIKNDSSTYLGNISRLVQKLRDTTNFYSDSLGKTLTLYNGNLSENKKLNEKVRFLLGNTKRDNSLQNKYESLLKDYDNLGNQKDSFSEVYQKEISKNKELVNKLTKSENSSETGYSSLEQSKKSFNVKNQNLLRNWKSLNPKFFGISGRYVSFKDNNPEKMEAFAKYKTGRLIPLERYDVSDRSCSFYLPYIDFPKGTIIVYAVDKDGNKSKEASVYISDDKVSKKKIE